MSVISPAPAAGTPATPAHIIADDREAIETARRLAAHFAAEAAVRDRERRLPWAELDRFADSGLWAITVPRDYGGADVNASTLANVIVEIGKADGSLAQIPQNHFYALEVLRVGGTEAQKRFFYERVLAGERLGNALAEIGRRDFKRQTRLVRDPGGWYVEGEKFYATGAIYAHWIPTHVTAEEGDGKTATWIVFIPRDAKGVTVVDDWDGFGQRITGSGTVRFEHVAVKPEWVVPLQHSFEQPTTIGPIGQIVHAAIDLGIGYGAYEETLRFVRERARPWLDSGVEKATDDPLTIREVGNVWVRLRAAHALLEKAARAVDAAQAEPTEESVAAASIAVSEARVLTTKSGLLAATKLFELTGTSATFAADNLDRYWRNVRTHSLHDPVRWKYQAIGNYYLNGVRPPRHGAL